VAGKKSDNKLQPHSQAFGLNLFEFTNSTEQSLSWKAKRHSTTQKFPAFYGNRSFISVFTNVYHWSV